MAENKSESRVASEESAKALIKLKLKRRRIEAKFQKARKDFWEKVDSKWAIFDGKLEAIRLEQEKEVGTQADRGKKWDEDRVAYVNYASDGRIMYDHRCDEAFSILDSEIDELENGDGGLYEAFENFMYAESLTVLALEEAVKKI